MGYPLKTLMYMIMKIPSRCNFCLLAVLLYGTPLARARVAACHPLSFLPPGVFRWYSTSVWNLRINGRSQTDMVSGGPRYGVRPPGSFSLHSVSREISDCVKHSRRVQDCIMMFTGIMSFAHSDMTCVFPQWETGNVHRLLERALA